MRKLNRAALAFAALAAAACTDQQPNPAAPPGAAQLNAARAADRIPGSYVVVLRGARGPQAANEVSSVAASVHATPSRVYTAALRGFAAQLTTSQVQALLQNPNVAFIDEDRVVRATTTQSGATWGLDRIDQRGWPLNGSFVYTPTGAGVHAYIVDTGILTTHTQFGGRASANFDAFADGQNGQDCNGHGTHVAGTVGGTTYGVAKGVTLHAVRVLDCGGSGSLAGLIAGIDWVATHRITPAVANMSLGFGGVVASADSAIDNLVAAGVTVVLAAGNDDIDACDNSPGRTPSAITVGATGNFDWRADFSNWGSCVDIFAPGVDITSAWYTGTSDTNTIQGTSMASPHVAGVAALYLQGHPAATPAAVTTAILNTATRNTVLDRKGSPDVFVYSRLATSGTGSNPCITATTIGVGQTLARSLASTDCEMPSGRLTDRYKLTLITGGDIQIDQGSATLDTYLYLENADGEVIDYDDDSGDGTNSLIADSLQAGTYYLRASSYFSGYTGDYTIQVSGNACGALGSSIGGVYSSNLSSADCSVGGRYSEHRNLIVTSTRAVRFEMTSSTVDSYLVLLDSLGNVITQNDNGAGGGNARIDRTLTPGVYTIRATTAGATLSGAYQLSVLDNTCSATTPAAVGNNYSGSFTTADCLSNTRYADTYALTVTRTTPVRLDMVSLSVDPYLVLLDSLGNVITQADNGAGGTNARIDRTLTAGSYRIRTTTATGALTGGYVLKVLDNVCNISRTATVSASYTGSLISTDCLLSDGTLADRWRLSIGTTTNLRLALSSTAFDAVVVLLDSAGTRIGVNDNGGGGTNARLDRTVTPGTYYVQTKSRLTGGAGAYTFTTSTF